MEVIDWILSNLKPRSVSTPELLYDAMASQSDERLPVIYQPFDAKRPDHWADRGAAFDFLAATQGYGKRLLDFGPGDGWPSLIVAPFAGEVIGVDGSQRRIQVCRQNASRLGIDNATFIYVRPGESLPFDDETFDGVMAASSLEQSPDPMAVLAEFHRVLRPEGRLRLSYESLREYRGTAEREAWILPIDSDHCRLMIYDRHIDAEFVTHYGLNYRASEEILTQILTSKGQDISFDNLTVAYLQETLPRLTDTYVCMTRHPRGKTLVDWLHAAGFRSVFPTHNGMEFAISLYHHLNPSQRPTSLAALDVYLRPLVETIVDFPASLDIDPMITAQK